LARHPEGVADLLPRPTALARQADAARFDLFGQPQERADGPEADGGVV